LKPGPLCKLSQRLVERLRRNGVKGTLILSQRAACPLTERRRDGACKKDRSTIFHLIPLCLYYLLEWDDAPK
jgi:hypothetical protein